MHGDAPDPQARFRNAARPQVTPGAYATLLSVRTSCSPPPPVRAEWVHVLTVREDRHADRQIAAGDVHAI